MKIIVFENKSKNRMINYVPIIFPNMLAHRHVAKFIKLLLFCMYPTNDFKIVSAGYCCIFDYEVNGKSESLNVGIDKNTNIAINGCDYNQFYNEENKPIK